MKSKIVENWLTNVKELTFTVPFCLLLLSKGQRVVHISSQGPMEQGKDIIAIDDAGRVYCYQLKCDNINSRVWAEIKAEIDQLVELPPRHPSLPERVEEWECYLVTNGGIANPTARDIYDYSESKRSRGHRPLKTIVGSELVADFTQFYDEFLPIDVLDLQQFLEQYNQHGDYELDLGKFKTFFEAYFRARHDASKQKKAEAVRASLVLCSYLLTHKYAQQNHLEIIKAYVLLLASVYEFVEAHHLADRLWRDTERLVYEAIRLEFKQLIDEVVEHPRNYVEDKYGVFSEVILYKVRCTELLGYLAAYTNYCALVSVEPYRPDEIEAITAKLSTQGALLGECMVPLVVNHVISLHGQGKDADAAQIVVGVLASIVLSHVGEARGLPSPYYSLARSVEWTLGIGEKIDEGFQWRSYTSRSLTLLATRLGLHDDLDELWRVLSRISCQEMIPADPKDYLLWRMKKGNQADRFPDAEQSWASLVAEAEANYSDSLPPVLKDRKHFLPLLINIMPHRFNHRFVLTLFDAVKPIAKQ